MIINMILDFIIFIVKILFQLVKSLFPVISVPLQWAYALGIILTTVSQANNFIYFMLGDTAFILLPSLILLIGWKYVGYPIISFIMGFISNKQA